jgi:oxygen-dependent protoporphyrinogen oxidase
MRVAIVGGGVTGLSTAYYLSRARVPATLIEKDRRLGGVIQTSRIEGCVVEGGPDSFLAAKPWALDLIGELGLASQVIGSNDHRRVTYILKHGRLIPLPDGLMMVVPTKLRPLVSSPLLSWRTKLCMGLEWFRRPVQALPDRSVEEFLLDHYGRESVDYLAEPLLAGVYGGDPAALSAASVLPRFVEMEAKYGSLTRGTQASMRTGASAAVGSLFRTLSGGLGDLIHALESAIAPHVSILNGRAESLQRTASGWRLRVNGDWLDASHVVLACPAWQAAAALGSVHAELAALLDTIPYTSSLTIALGYRRAELNHPLNGFGFLVPKRERRHVLACTWVGTKFEHRVPDDMALLRCFLTGESLGQTDDTLAAFVRAELRDIMGITADPLFVKIARWPRSMAQYTVGHTQRVTRIEALEGQLPGLHLAGNAYHGIGIPDCIRGGKEAVARITAV